MNFLVENSLHLFLVIFQFCLQFFFLASSLPEFHLGVTADASRLGQWLAIERDMVNWAREQGIGRRTYQQCKRRFAVLNPSASTAYNEVSTWVRTGEREGIHRVGVERASNMFPQDGNGTLITSQSFIK